MQYLLYFPLLHWYWRFSTAVACVQGERIIMRRLFSLCKGYCNSVICRDRHLQKQRHLGRGAPVICKTVRSLFSPPFCGSWLRQSVVTVQPYFCATEFLGVVSRCFLPYSCASMMVALPCTGKKFSSLWRKCYPPAAAHEFLCASSSAWTILCCKIKSDRKA